MGSNEATSLAEVPTLVRDPQPKEFEALLERRRQLGQDRYDEVWDGVYVMNPPRATSISGWPSSWPCSWIPSRGRWDWRPWPAA